ncbi:MAG: hypothetical protein ISS19_13675 [Bacteroidales bacterium]|nr:hypothetical protein [Bacteroidales bacterium]
MRLTFALLLLFPGISAYPQVNHSDVVLIFNNVYPDGGDLYESCERIGFAELTGLFGFAELRNSFPRSLLRRVNPRAVIKSIEIFHI